MLNIHAKISRYHTMSAKNNDGIFQDVSKSKENTICNGIWFLLLEARQHEALQDDVREFDFSTIVSC